MRREERRDLGGVDRRAAADPDEAVEAALARGGDRVERGLLARLDPRSAVDLRVDPELGDRGPDALGDAEVDDVRVADEHRPPDAEASEVEAGLLRGAPEPKTIGVASTVKTVSFTRLPGGSVSHWRYYAAVGGGGADDRLLPRGRLRPDEQLRRHRRRPAPPGRARRLHRRGVVRRDPRGQGIRGAADAPRAAAGGAGESRASSGRTSSVTRRRTSAADDRAARAVPAPTWQALVDGSKYVDERLGGDLRRGSSPT